MLLPRARLDPPSTTVDDLLHLYSIEAIVLSIPFHAFLGSS